MSHSPGPFRYKRRRSCDGDFEIIAADGYTVAAIPYDEEYGRPDEDEANAILFAAAPKMYETLKEAKRTFGDRFPDIIAAIDAAEGRA